MCTEALRPINIRKARIFEKKNEEFGNTENIMKK
jgi:hypothetical protein